MIMTSVSDSAIGLSEGVLETQQYVILFFYHHEYWLAPNSDGVGGSALERLKEQETLMQQKAR